MCVLRGSAGYEEDPLWEEQLSVRRNPVVNFLWGRGRIEGWDGTSLATKAGGLSSFGHLKSNHFSFGFDKNVFSFTACLLIY